MVDESVSSGVRSIQSGTEDRAEYANPSILTVPVSLTGSIKWFDVAKGFGFVVPDGGGPDILLHVTCLQRDGFVDRHSPIPIAATPYPCGRHADEPFGQSEGEMV